MPKAIISNRIYLDNPGELITAEIRKRLTYKIIVAAGGRGGKGNPVLTIKNYKNLPKGILSIPQMRMDLIPEDYEIVDNRVLVPVEFPECKFPLYDNQQVIYDEADDSCIINALVGWGKSFVGLYLAKKFGQRTLIVTHTVALRDQWVEEIATLFGIEAGVIGGGKLDYKDKIITVANTQTLKKHVGTVAKEFGTVIVDECHRTAATTFSEIVNGMYARYRIGLSGTLVRKDKKHVVIPDYFGSKVLIPPEANTLTPKILLVKTGITLNADLAWVDRITQLVRDKKYLNLVAKVAAVQIDKGHKVLIISDRVEFLVAMGEMLGDACAVVTGEIGDRNEAKRQILDGEISCIAGSRGIFSEGISINPLSCVLLATPINNDSLLEQIIGRIQRRHVGKLAPTVLDFQFAGWNDKRQNTARLELYLRKQWEISTL